MDLRYQRRLAAEVLGVGENNIIFDPEHLDRVANAVTREDIKKLVEEGIIKVENPRRNSRGRWRIRHEARKKGRHRGPGSRKGSLNARTSHYHRWVYRIRKIRRFLKWLRDQKIIDSKTYRRLYRLAKGGAFDSLASLKRYLKENNLLPPDFK